MDFLLFIFMLAHISIGYGVMRIFRRITNCKLAREFEDNLITLMIWPMLMIIIAMNSDMLKDQFID